MTEVTRSWHTVAGNSRPLYPNAPRGLVFPGDAGISPTTYNKDWNNLAPRVGLAWLPFGPNSKTSIRSGYGVFYNTERGYLLNETQLNQPFVLNVSIPNPPSFEDPWANFPGGNLYPFTPPTSDADRAAYQFTLPMPISRFFDPLSVTPNNQQWNFSIEHEFPGQIVLSTAYVGSKGTHLWVNREINPAVFIPGNGPDGKPLSTAGNIDKRRLDQNFQGIDEASTTGNSTYHSLQVTVTRRFSKGLYVMSNYTWSKALDYESLDRNSSLAQDPNNMRAEHGPADYDRRHNFVATFLYELPTPWRHGIGGVLTRGWRINGIYHYISGSPLTVVPGTDRALQGGGNQRANVVGNPVLSAGRSFDQQRAEYFDTSAFAMPAIGTFGNMGRNAIYGPGQYNLDASFFKVTEHDRASPPGTSLGDVQRIQPRESGQSKHEPQFFSVRPHRYGDRTAHHAGRSEGDLLAAAPSAPCCRPNRGVGRPHTDASSPGAASAPHSSAAFRTQDSIDQPACDRAPDSTRDPCRNHRPIPRLMSFPVPYT